MSENFDCPHCGQDLRLPPDALAKLEATELVAIRYLVEHGWYTNKRALSEVRAMVAQKQNEQEE